MFAYNSISKNLFDHCSILVVIARCGVAPSCIKYDQASFRRDLSSSTNHDTHYTILMSGLVY